MEKVLRAFFYHGSVYTIRADAAKHIDDIDWEADWGDFPKNYFDDACPFPDYREKSGVFSYLYQPNLGNLDEDLLWLKSNPRPAHREVFQRGEVVDEANRMKVVKVLENVTLLDMIEALKEFMTL